MGCCQAPTRNIICCELPSRRQPPSVAAGSQWLISLRDVGASAWVREATTALGEAADFSAFDLDEQALRVYSDNFVGSLTHSRDLAEVVDGDLGARPTRKEDRRRHSLSLARRRSALSRALRGEQPGCVTETSGIGCNRTAVRAAELLEPQALIIENVPASDSHQVVDRAVERLEDLGYWVDVGIVDVLLGSRSDVVALLPRNTDRASTG